jgi:hypothetical protein
VFFVFFFSISYLGFPNRPVSSLYIMVPDGYFVAGYAYQKHQAKDDRKEAKSRQEEIKTPQGPT